MVAVEWSTIASLATAFGTLVLAIATFSAVRSSNRSARVAESALLAGIRPLLLTARLEDPPQKVTWGDNHFTRLAGGYGAFERDGDVLYLACPLRNAGTGLAVLHGWHVPEPVVFRDPGQQPAAAERFRRLTRDLYIAPGDTGFWQGAIRDADDPDREAVERLYEARERFVVDVMYGDQEGGQRTVTRLLFTPVRESQWLCTTSRHWFLDRPDPR